MDVARGRWRARLLSGLDYHGEAYCGIFSPDSRRVFADKTGKLAKNWQ